jgi:hypothetical protein
VQEAVRRTLAWTAALGLAACASGRGAGSGDLDGGAPDLSATVPSAGDPFPPGAISFFHADACPSGWANYPSAQGRTVVPAPADDAGAAGQWGKPLVDGEDRLHGHDGGVLSVSFPSVSFVGAPGGGNAVGAAGTFDVPVSSSIDRAGLPYVELWACRKVMGAVAGSQPLPSGLVAFFDGDCPTGWSRSPKLDGRYLVGLPTGGAPAAQFGGPPLQRGEARAHSHGIAGAVVTSPKGIALASGCCGDGYAQNGMQSFAGTTPPAVAALPYLHLVACVTP